MLRFAANEGGVRLDKNGYFMPVKEHEAVMKALSDKVLSVQPAMLETIKREGFVFDGSCGPWEKLAMTMYSEICALDQQVRAMMEDE